MVIDDVAFIAITTIAISNKETNRHMIKPSVQSSLSTGLMLSLGEVLVNVVDVVEVVFFANTKTHLIHAMKNRLVKEYIWLADVKYGILVVWLMDDKVYV
ncbi:hypothetical protein AWRI3578_g1419 [Hanseniaspora opuntiae]|uniref:Uncharacterized protein n=1 Tax=Hanseniaspora opuntiae TaxID=211096 RepID=A0A1E5RKK7_9ASCO|nr:hypothetical protein AWRI3578_g1419 [Hanseniaspora opuntiae]